MTYLSHDDLITIIPDLQITTALPNEPFTLDQVSVCSINLRCDGVFWEQRRFAGSLDLGAPVLMDTSPRRFWRRREITPGQAIKVKPGKMILGRTYENFRIPPTYAGKITSRSSYARLGIEISCTCDLINPGWNGHVPLEITNNGSHTILIYPLLPISQIFLIPLSSPAKSDYSDRAKFKSKYMNDDGGPSYWWRDAVVEKMYRSYLADRLDQQAIDRLGSELEKMDDDGIFRFERFIHQNRFGDMSNVDDIIHGFLGSERKSKMKYQAKCWVRGSFSAILLPTAFGGIYFSSSFELIHWVVFALTMFVGVWALVSWVRSRGEDPRFMISP